MFIARLHQTIHRSVASSVMQTRTTSRPATVRMATTRPTCGNNSLQSNLTLSNAGFGQTTFSRIWRRLIADWSPEGRLSLRGGAREVGSPAPPARCVLGEGAIESDDPSIRSLHSGVYPTKVGFLSLQKIASFTDIE
jgi:hypothetical protein